jgi:hypothetical protein
MLAARSSSGRYRRWDVIVRTLRAHPGVWAVRLTDEPARLVRTVRERAAPELHLDDGVVEARLVNGYVDTAGRRKGDVYLRFRSDDE